MRSIIAAVLFAVLSLFSPAHAGGLPDPFVTPDIVQILPVCNTSWQCNAPYRDTNAKMVIRTIDLTKKTLVVLENGQSNGEGEGEIPYPATNAAHIFNFNYADGSLYQGGDPQLGASVNSTGPGYMNTAVADMMISDGSFEQVILVPTNIGGSPVQLWADGGSLQDVPCIAMKRLAQRGIVQGGNVYFAADWTQGESDRQGPTQVGTTQVQYTIRLNQVYTRLSGCGFAGRFFTNIVSWSGTDNWPPVAAAQAGMANGVDRFTGANLDSLGNSYRIDMTHFNSATGIPTGARMKASAWHASGAPF